MLASTLKKVLCLFALSLIFAPAFLTAEEIEIAEGIVLDGQIRERTEFDDRSFYENADIIEKSYLRTRLGLNFKRIRNTEIYFQVQDSRNLGSNSGGLENDINLGVHQAFIKIKFARWDRLWAQLGRFEVKYGRERFIGTVNWSNVGRTFDGIRFGYVGDLMTADIFLLKIVERGFDFPPRAGDHNFYGLYTKWLDKHLQLFYLLDYDHQESLPGSDEPSLARWTLGGYYHRETSAGLDVKLDAAYQAGSYHRINVDNISAYMFAGEFGYKFVKSKIKPRIAGGFDITSGDDGTDSDELNTYNNLYYTGHAFRGYMDYFVENPFAGLLDLYVRFQVAPHQDWWMGLDLHYFQTMEEYYVVDPIIDFARSNNLGEEIDFTAKYRIYDGLDGQGGASFFFPSDDWQGNDAKTGTWFYFMFTAWM
jgi:hypothetical protein